MKRWSLGLYIALLVISVLIIYNSITELSLSEYGQPGSGLLPFLLAIILAALTLILLFTGEFKNGEGKVFLLPGPAKRLLLAITLILGSGLVFEFLGAPVTVGIMIALWLILLERRRLWIAFLTGGLTGFAVWLVFVVAFKAQLPLGFWTR
ncbi:MAG TPA: hypothetical protein DHD79_10100 [Firmicutes bacterium]|jgi:membrane protease YdiL (CAAX protease family)|nr:hypothetical protein [Bacillota bacterium]HBE07059.1 hypothetical protein [Bacillota bacterium]HBL49152.1 hypothetical protein [Bacillota bacterium]HBL68764.1 hypothetical protein [Bacillota bacterium]HBR25155.1 hypothetical protein [Bacillota bacterium]